MTTEFARLTDSLADRYVIDRELGAGGMATVYLAEDLRHRRKVAIKVLHPELSAVIGSERFLKEIELTANLQHPHILPLFDSGDVNGQLYYVMPLVDGETLRSRLEREQQLPVADAIRIAREVADALAYAHKRGVVHRDIKPENVLLQDGHALVADFGIALAVQQAGAGRMTQTGLSLGTPQYMSPEQAMGERAIDLRADIYALGAVTYEMLAGEPPFTGPTAQAIIARAMTERPRDLLAVRETLPVAVNVAVMTALAKLPADRFSTAAEFAAALGADSPTLTQASGARGATSPAHRASVLRAAAPWLVATAAIFAGAWAMVRTPSAEPAHSIRAMLPIGDSANVGVADVRVLPGDSLILVAGRLRHGDGLSLIRLSTGEAVPLPGTEGAFAPSISPDGRSVAYVAKGQLWRTSILEGRPTALAPVKDVRCTAWGAGDRIAVGEDEGFTVVVVPAGGGAKDTLSNARQRTRFYSLAAFPDGRFLGAGGGTMWMLGGKRLLRITRRGPVDSAIAGDTVGAPEGSRVSLLGSGYLAWISRDRELMVAPIDAASARLTGAAVALADSVTDAEFGTRGLAVLSRGPSYKEGVLVIADRTGRRDTLPYPIAEYRTFDVSPDGRRVAVVVASGRTPELRLLDVARSASRVLDLGRPGVRPHEPRWSPDGKSIAVGAYDGDKRMLLLLHPDDARHVDTLFRDEFIPHSWSPDGSELAGSVLGVEYGALARLRPGKDSVPRAGPRVNGNEWYQSFSPDGRWYVFMSTGFRADQSGLYVAENREGASPTRIAPARFDDPVWSPNGREILVIDYEANSISSIPVRAATPPEFGEPRPLFSARGWINFPGMDHHVLRDGRIAFVDGPQRVPVRALTLLTDWRVDYARLTARARRP